MILAPVLGMHAQMGRAGQVGARPDFLAWDGGISALRREAVSAGGWGGLGDGLTKMQPLPGELPLAGVIGQVFTLLLQRHLPGVHDDGQVAGLDVCVGWLGWGVGQLIDGAIPPSWVRLPQSLKDFLKVSVLWDSLARRGPTD